MGMNYQWSWFTAGAALSSSLEPAASIGLKFNHFSMIYNADYAQSAMTGERNLSHQLTLRVNTKRKYYGRNFMNRGI